MAQYKPQHMKESKSKRKKKSNPNRKRDWTGILINALLDLLIGTLLLLIRDMMD